MIDTIERVHDDQSWLLPDGICEILPPGAGILEQSRRTVLELFRTCGYQLIFPPLVEPLESLLAGAGSDLELRTFQVIDQLTGKTLGIRADMTVQAARIDARHMPQDRPVRLCYVGTVLRTLPDDSGSGRAPIQMGAELYGHAGYESDLEVVSLMLEALGRLGIDKLHVDLGHVGIFRELARAAGLEPSEESKVHEALQRKARPELEAMLSVSPERRRLLALCELNGDRSVLDEARGTIDSVGTAVSDYLQTLANLHDRLADRFPEVRIHIDLAELRGYAYHTGTVFAAYTPDRGQEIARGGRYDDIGAAFGDPRPATGFSADLGALVELISERSPMQPLRGGICAPWSDDTALHRVVEALRAEGEVVVYQLPGAEVSSAALDCDRALVLRDGVWQIDT